MAEEVCQRPKRASLISTVPSGTPYKYWLSGPIFAGICLNILIITVSPTFFGMFTICSYFQVISRHSQTKLLYIKTTSG